MSKVLICRCEDVLLSDIEEAIASGNEDVESLKRYTGFGTGVCQGKSCVTHVARVLCERAGKPLDRVHPFTPRPPVAPIPLRLLAAAEEIAEPEIRGRRK